ncbi:MULTISPECIES: hypothetical protein [unclassified Chamaesiphon]|uniref:hypothetical protein n=1 Tax=unclassified Chamaesiphon TaxID=2620921 RepID=UPI00286C044C|nr:MULTISPECIES: hypothetical protein [unclassified Chamaesiphon]
MYTRKLSLLVLSTLLIAGSPAYSATQPTANLNPTPNKTLLAQQDRAPDLITVGVSLINSLINPPSRSAQINADAEVKKAKIAADADIAKEKLRIEASQNTDRVAPVLNQWGVTRIACAPGLVFINGITTDTVCIQPSADINPGYYSYDSARKQLIRNSSSVQTTQNTQQTRVSNSNSERGF